MNGFYDDRSILFIPSSEKNRTNEPVSVSTIRTTCLDELLPTTHRKVTDMSFEQVDAENALKAALDKFNMVCMGVSDEGELVEIRESQMEMIEMTAHMSIQSYKN